MPLQRILYPGMVSLIEPPGVPEEVQGEPADALVRQIRADCIPIHKFPLQNTDHTQGRGELQPKDLVGPFQPLFQGADVIPVNDPAGPFDYILYLSFEGLPGRYLPVATPIKAVNMEERKPGPMRQFSTKGGFTRPVAADNQDPLHTAPPTPCQ